MASRIELERELERLRDDLTRFKEAGQAALGEIDWVIGYLDRSRRTGLADELRRNRASILRARDADAGGTTEGARKGGEET